MTEEDRKMPMNSLDLEYMLTDTEWGKIVPKELKDKLTQTKVRAFYNEETNEVEYKLSQESLWEILAFYKKEMRLAYINREELIYCQFFLDFAGDCLTYENPRAFLKALRCAITVLELSQSKGGFLRKRHGTITTEERKEPEQEEDKKKGLKFFGGKKRW